MALEVAPTCEAAQRFCDDVVLLAGFVKPNAAGRSELSSLRALSDRQLLKSRGLYLASRVLLAVTPVEVVAIAMDSAAFGRTRRLVWTLSDLVVERVPARSDPASPALLLSRAGFRPAVEIAPVPGDAASASVIERLLPEYDHS
jgi:hypothetical protein